MGAPYTITSVSNYNSNPPSDDGSQTAANRVQWSTQKTKLSDPIKTAFDASETNTSAAFAKVIGGGSETTTAISYTVTASDQGKLVKATVAGVTITTPDATVVGSPFVFGLLNNSSGDITFAGNGTQTVDGSLTTTIPAGCGCLINTDGSNWHTFGQNYNNVLSAPQGRLTLTSGTPVLNGDTSGSTVYYTPYIGDRMPISTDGATFKVRQFSELSLTLVANHLANTIYDVFVFDNSGTLTIGTGPAWNNSGGGTGARGTGAGTTELTKVHGILVNKNSMTARNGSTTYTVAANEGTYVGSIFIDGSAGSVTCHFSYGQSRKFGVWNAFNRVPIILQAGDGTASWAYNTTNTPRPSNNNSANNLTTFTGLAEEEADLSFVQQAAITSSFSNSGFSGEAAIGIGVNNSTALNGLVGDYAAGFVNTTSGTATYKGMMVAQDILSPSLGINVAYAVEDTKSSTAATITYNGTNGNMLLKAIYRG